MKKLVMILIILPMVSFAITEEQKQAALEANKKYLKGMGLMAPDADIKIVLANKLRLSKKQQDQNAAKTKEKQKRGFYPVYSARAAELLSMESIIQAHTLLDTANDKPYETHLRHNAKEMKMAYDYKGIPHASGDHFLGIAPAGTYLDDHGWTGSVAFFKRSGLGTCAFTERNIKLSGGAARILKDEATDDVNDQITLVDALGTKESGFLVSVKWFDNVFVRELECAMPSFSVAAKKSTIQLAIDIDKRANAVL